MFQNKTENTQISDIQYAEIKKNYTIKGKEIVIRIQNGMTGMVNGKREILDEVLIESMMERVVQAIKQNHSKYNPIPEEIILRTSSYKKTESKKQTVAEQENTSTEAKIIESYEPRVTLEQVALNQEVREQIQTAIVAVQYKKKLSEEWEMSDDLLGNRAIILNFYGKAGTGKSMTAEAVAKALGKKVYHINYAELESKYVGETPKNIRKAFECATRDDAVLIFDEADSFLGKRLSSVTQSADYGVNITRSVLLMELEKFCGVVVFTTNLISNYDEAFKRRILLSVYFALPNEEARTQIWRLHLGKKMPLQEEVTAELLASRYTEVSGADIKDMVFYAALHTLKQGKEKMDSSVFDYAYATIQERYRNRGQEAEVQIVSTETITEEQYQQEINRQEG